MISFFRNFIDGLMNEWSVLNEYNKIKKSNYINSAAELLSALYFDDIKKGKMIDFVVRNFKIIHLKESSMCSRIENLWNHCLIQDKDSMTALHLHKTIALGERQAKRAITAIPEAIKMMKKEAASKEDAQFTLQLLEDDEFVADSKRVIEATSLSIIESRLNVLIEKYRYKSGYENYSCECFNMRVFFLSVIVACGSGKKLYDVLKSVYVLDAGFSQRSHRDMIGKQRQQYGMAQRLARGPTTVYLWAQGLKPKVSQPRRGTRSH
jgi:hypothetical protein